jgi:hypothetical protein
MTVEDVEKVAAHDANTVHTSSTATIHVNDPDTAKQVIVSWDGPEDRNWSNYRRWMGTVFVSFTFIRSVPSFNYHDPATELLFVFASPVASSISSPSLSVISAHLKIQPGVILEKMTLSIFVLAYAIGVSHLLREVMRVLKIRKAAVLGSTERALWTFVRPAGVEYPVPRYEPRLRLFFQALMFRSRCLIRSAPSQRHQYSTWFFDSQLVL